MIKVLVAIHLIVSTYAWSQSSKSIEVPDDTIMREDERLQREMKEEQQARKEWDREEEEARELEERRRLIDEERAETDVLYPPRRVLPNKAPAP